MDGNTSNPASGKLVKDRVTPLQMFSKKINNFVYIEVKILLTRFVIPLHRSFKKFHRVPVPSISRKQNSLTFP